MAFQIISSFALSIPANIVGASFVAMQIGKLRDKNESTVNKIIFCTTYGLFTGAIPSFIFEMSRIGLNHFTPKLLAKVPTALAILARVVAHLAAPFIGAIIIGNCLPKSWEKSLGDLLEKTLDRFMIKN